MKRDLNAILKAKEAEAAKSANKDEEMHLDDAQRVKIISPGRLVAKRFVRNRLAIVGSCLLIFMFAFSFLFPLFYGWGQTETDYKYEAITKNYALARENKDYQNYSINGGTALTSVANRMNSYISAMEANGVTHQVVSDTEGANSFYSVDQIAQNVYTLSSYDSQKVCTFGEYTYLIGQYSMLGKSMTYEGEALGAAFESAVAAAKDGESFTYGGATYQKVKGTAPKTSDIYVERNGFTYEGAALDEGFEAAANAASAAGQSEFTYNDVHYGIISDGLGTNIVGSLTNETPVIVSTKYYYVMQESGSTVSDEVRANSLLALASGEDFQADGTTYQIGEEDGNPAFYLSDGTLYAELSTFVIRRYDGTDTMNYDLKAALLNAIYEMEERGEQTSSFTYDLPKQSEADGSYELDENGNYIYEPATMNISRSNVQEYVVTASLTSYLINNNSAPSAKHPFGTDGDGYDVLARMMYGGRISLMVGFVVVILETLLGVIMGGIAGYFGGAVDNIIMRLVDIFYCLPSMPILIILGAMMDAQRFSTYGRLFVMMASLGIMGWAGIARLVRGQILSLREQEFMVATEATGVRVSRRIFRHLVPNVMPQLIVTATSGLGGIILIESTLSFLGLGVKHPLATWGTMINSVSSQAALEHYYYIWIPVGLLICLTVIAFNFVGDGLRDAFDPRSKE